MFTIFKTTRSPVFSFGFACKPEVDSECCLEILNKSSTSLAHVRQAMSLGRNLPQNPRHLKPIKNLDSCVARDLFLVFSFEEGTEGCNQELKKDSFHDTFRCRKDIAV